MGKETRANDSDAKANAKMRPRRIRSGANNVATTSSSTSLSVSATFTADTTSLGLDSNQHHDIPSQPGRTPSLDSAASSNSGVRRLDSAKQRTTRGRSGQKLKKSNSSDDETTLVDQKNHHDDSTDASLYTPGAFAVSANDSMEFVTSDIENEKEYAAPILQPTGALLVAAEVVTDHDGKEKGLDEEDLELKIAKAVESRLMQRDQALVVAEIVPPSTESMKGDGPTIVYKSSCAECCSSCCMKWKYPIIVLLLVLIGAVVAIVLTSGGSSVDPYATTTPPSNPSNPSIDGKLQEIQQIIQKGADPAPFQDPNSPQSLALAWLGTDPVTTSPDKFTPPSVILQRYALAVLYFSTNGNVWTNQLGFLSNLPSCEWNDGSQIPFPSSASALPSVPDTFGVHCDNFANVKQIRLSQNGLNGTIPTELSLLMDLQVLGVDQNALVGSIPPELGRLSDMRQVFVDTNAMTGSIPTEIGMWIPLESFHANDNQFEGTLPTEFGRLAYLQDVYVYNNFLSGTVPSELSIITNVDVQFDPQQVSEN
jgi:hypothetical protein